MKEIPRNLVEKAAEGDMEAFRAIYDMVSAYVYTVSVRITVNKEDAEEVTQDVFISLYHNLKGFNFRSSFKTWLYRITVNRSINKLRARRKDRMTVAYDGEIHDIHSAEKEDDSKKEHEGKIIDDLLMFLPPDQRACITLRNTQGLSYKEISEVLKINLNTVRTRLKRARERLIQYVRSKEKSYDSLR